MRLSRGTHRAAAGVTYSAWSATCTGRAWKGTKSSATKTTSGRHDPPRDHHRRGLADLRRGDGGGPGRGAGHGRGGGGGGGPRRGGGGPGRGRGGGGGPAPPPGGGRPPPRGCP